MIGTVIKVLKVLNSETGPWQLSFGIAFGMVLGLTPLLSVHNLFIVLALFWLRVNISLCLVSFGVFSGVAFFLDPLFHTFGFSILNALQMEPLWTGWYNEAFMRWSRFNNTVVMGSFCFSLLAFVPILFLSRLGVTYYRARWQKRLEQTPLMKWLQTTRITEAFSRIGE